MYKTCSPVMYQLRVRTAGASWLLHQSTTCDVLLVRIDVNVSKEFNSVVSVRVHTVEPLKVADGPAVCREYTV